MPESKVAIGSIELNGNTILLRRNHIVCFVGPNGSGKTRSLRAIYARAHGEDFAEASHVTAATITNNLKVSDYEVYLGPRVIRGKQGISWYGGEVRFTTTVSALSWLSNVLANKHYGQIKNLFMYMVGARSRFDAILPADHLFMQESAPQKPLNLLYSDLLTEKKTSDICKEVFGKEVSINPGGGSKITLHVGSRLDPSRYGGERTQAYASEIGKLPLIENEGDGIQATVGLMATLSEPNVEVFFVDEPDLYLHPPQAYKIAKIIAREKKHRQLFFSTHSARFIQALAEHAPDRLLLIRLDNDGGVYTSSHVNIQAFSEIRSSPILKFNNIIESIFYRRTVVCEDSSDCLLFSTSLDQAGRGDLNESTYWIGTNGKTNLAKTVYTLINLSVRPLVLADFDLMRPEHLHRDLLPLVRDIGGNPDEIQEFLVDKVYKQIDNNDKVEWSSLKLLGMRAVGPFADIYRSFDTIIRSLAEIGILINRFGEAESLCEPRPAGHGAEAVNEILSFDMQDDRLTNLRNFTTQIAGALEREI